VRRALPVLVSCALSAALLYLAVPRTLASWAGLPAQSALVKLREGEAPSDRDLKEGVSGLERALQWVATGRRLTDLALLEFTQAQRLPPSDSARATLLASADRHLVEGLAADPVDGFAWFRLAVVRSLRQAPPREVAAALAQSLDMAPNARRLWAPRATLCLAYWRAFTFEELLAVRAQLRIIWATDIALREPLLQGALEARGLPVLLWALADTAPSEADVELLKATVK
jgi:hypothetical protein